MSNGDAAADRKWRAEKILSYLDALLKESNDSARESIRAFYQALITLAAGAVTASVAFVEKIAPAPRQSTWLLVVAWTCFVVSLISSVVGFRQFGRECEREQRRINDWAYRICFGKWDGESEEATLGPTDDPITHDISTHLTWAAIALFCAGVVFLIWFSGANLKWGIRKSSGLKMVTASA